MGIQVCPLPTAILSNHTGGFDTFSFVDFTDHMQDYICLLYTSNEILAILKAKDVELEPAENTYHDSTIFGKFYGNSGGCLLYTSRCV